MLGIPQPRSRASRGLILLTVAPLWAVACGEFIGAGDLRGAPDGGAGTSNTAGGWNGGAAGEAPGGIGNGPAGGSLNAAGTAGETEAAGTAGAAGTADATGNAGAAGTADATGTAGEGGSVGEAGGGSGGTGGLGSEPCNLKWVSGGADPNLLPANAVFAGDEVDGQAPNGVFHFHVCRLTSSSSVYPGKWLEGLGCYASNGTAETGSTAYELLTASSGCLVWRAFSAGESLIVGVLGGHAGSSDLYVCRAKLNTETHPGYVGESTAGKCRIGYHTATKDVSSFDLLVSN